MRLVKHLSDPCVRALLSKRLNCWPNNLDAEIENLLRKDTEGEFEDATEKLDRFSLSSFKNCEKIEGALNEYILLMVLNAIYQNVNGRFLFDRITSGLVIENIVEAVIRTRLTKGHTCKFIDKHGIDFVIERNNTMIAGIQCKALLEVGKSKLSIGTLSKRLRNTRKSFQDKADMALALFYGYLHYPKSKHHETRSKYQKILRGLKSEGWRIFRVFKDYYNGYSIDNSMVEFIKFIEDVQIVRKC